MGTDFNMLMLVNVYVQGCDQEGPSHSNMWKPMTKWDDPIWDPL